MHDGVANDNKGPDDLRRKSKKKTDLNQVTTIQMKKK